MPRPYTYLAPYAGIKGMAHIIRDGRYPPIAFAVPRALCGYSPVSIGWGYTAILPPHRRTCKTCVRRAS